MKELYHLSFNELMEQIGKGRGMTGSGTVAALSAVASAELLVSICKLTLAKERYDAIKATVTNLQQKLESESIPELKRIMQEDAQVVGQMIKNRVMRDKATSAEEKEQFQKEARLYLGRAIGTSLALAGITLSILEEGALILYKDGLQSAKGDVAVGINNLITTVGNGLLMAQINIKAYKDEEALTVLKNTQQRLDILKSEWQKSLSLPALQ